MTHRMRLHPGPFSMIQSGQKTVELRLNDEKRQKIAVGDTVIFTCTATGEAFSATVTGLHRFNSFADLYKALPLLQCGYTQDDIHTASPQDMDVYYTPQQQAKYGVVGIAISRNL